MGALSPSLMLVTPGSASNATMADGCVSTFRSPDDPPSFRIEPHDDNPTDPLRARVTTGSTALQESVFDLAFYRTAQNRCIWRFRLRDVDRTATRERPVHVPQVGCRYCSRDGDHRGSTQQYSRAGRDGERRRHWKPQWPVHTSMFGEGEDCLHHRRERKWFARAAAEWRDFKRLIPG